MTAPQVGWHRFEDEIIPSRGEIQQLPAEANTRSETNARSPRAGREGWMDVARAILLPKFSARRDGGW